MAVREEKHFMALGDGNTLLVMVEAQRRILESAGLSVASSLLTKGLQV